MTVYGVMRFVFILLMLAGLSACGSTRTAEVKYQPLFDYSTIESYGLYSRSDKFAEWQLLSDGVRNGIELAIEQAMDSKGLQFKQASEADIVVTYYMVGRDNRSFRTYNLGVNYCSYCLVNLDTGSREDKMRIAPGTLIIDVVRPKNSRSIWRAIYPLNIREKDNSLIINEKVHHAVEQMILQFDPSNIQGKTNA
ncbi:DUF4136 domain-containing protein [Colwellia sp. MEBiC06753]